MNRFLLLTLLTSLIGFSQNPIQPNHQNFNDDIPQELVERMNPFYLEFGDDGMDFNPSQKLNIKENQSFQSEMIVQNSEYTLRLDRTKYFDFGLKSYEYHYDEFGNLTYYNVSSYDLLDRDEGFFDENNNLIVQYRVYLDGICEGWCVNQKNEFSYNDNGTLNNQEIYGPSESGSYINLISNVKWNYNEVGNISSVLNYFYSNLINDLYPKNIDNYSYDSHNRLVSVNNTNISNENINFLSEEYFYNNGNLSRFIDYDYHYKTSCELGIGSKGEYYYDENGNQTLYIRYSWDTTTQSFFPYSKIEYSYDVSGNLILRRYYLWNESNQNYLSHIDNEYTYDENGNLNLKVSYNYINETRIPYSKTEFTYDSFNLKTSEVLFLYYQNPNHPNGGDFIPLYMMVIETFSESDNELIREGVIYHTNNGQWSTFHELEGEEFKSYWYYTKESSLSTNSVESNSFLIYPNPTSNSLHINSSESLLNPLFELYDVKGSKILSNPFKLTEPIDVSDLQPSMYIYNVKDGSEVKQSGKVIIE